MALMDLEETLRKAITAAIAEFEQAGEGFRNVNKKEIHKNEFCDAGHYGGDGVLRQGDRLEFLKLDFQQSHPNRNSDLRPP